AAARDSSCPERLGAGRLRTTFQQLSPEPVGQVSVLRGSGDQRKPALGLHWLAIARASAVLRARWLRIRHVSDADDRGAWILQGSTAGLHGVPGIPGAACALEAILQLLVCCGSSDHRSGLAGVGLWFPDFPRAHPRRLLRNCNAGPHLRRYPT